MKKIYISIISLLIFLFVGCTPLSVKVENLISEGNYIEAKQALIDEEAGDLVSKEAAEDEEVLLARKRFKELMGDEGVRLVDENNGQGNPNKALSELNELIRLCSWSDKLHNLKEKQNKLLGTLIDFDKSLLKAANVRWIVSGDLSLQRDVLKSAKQYLPLLNDSPVIVSHITNVEDVILEDWTRVISGSLILEDNIRSQFHNDLKLVGTPYNYLKEIADIQSVTAEFLTSDNPLLKSGSFRNGVLTFFIRSEKAGPMPLRKLRKSLSLNLRHVYFSALKKILSDQEVNYSTVIYAEKVSSSISPSHEEIIPMLALVHLNRAKLLAPTGRASILALIHLERAEQLGLSLSDNRLKQVRDIAIATFSSAGEFELSIQILTNKSDSPMLQEMISTQLYKKLQRKSLPHIRYNLLSPYDPPGSVVLSFDSINMLIPSKSDLRSVVSTYFSHYEKVPNPTKSYLESRLSSQKLSLSFAESSYDSAISSHNIYPTQSSLSSVNYAKNNYISELNSYNSLVRQYNSTPNLISSPVFMPYSFQEGTVFHGWRLDGNMEVMKKKRNFNVSDVNKDFVRLGSRLDDKETKYRRQDLLDIPVGFDHLFEQLDHSIDEVVDRLSGMLTGLNFEDRIDLEPPEELLLSTLLHPFGIKNEGGSSNLPKWANGLIKKVVIPQIRERKPPSILIASLPNIQNFNTAESAYKEYSKSVGLIFTSGDQFSIGSGALIGPDGLFLTCAHVLYGKKIEVVFPAVSSKIFKTEIVFVNEKHDVALLRVKDYHSKNWLPIALEDETTSGESVIAIGNPSLGDGEIAVNSLSEGIIAKPYSTTGRSSLDRIVANITIASGSSGGPLISLKTGKIVGIITAVVAPTVSNDFASSGYRALAAPSNMLSTWLGLKH
jgi:S1-C subfamily serine protease